MNWTYTYGIRAEELSNEDVRIWREDDRRHLYKKDASGYIPSSGIYSVLTKDTAGFPLREKDGTQYRFDVNGRLSYIEDLFGNQNTLLYEDIYGAERLHYITDSSGRSLAIEYWPDGKIKETAYPANCKYQYFP